MTRGRRNAKSRGRRGTKGARCTTDPTCEPAQSKDGSPGCFVITDREANGYCAPHEAAVEGTSDRTHSWRNCEARSAAEKSADMDPIGFWSTSEARDMRVFQNRDSRKR